MKKICILWGATAFMLFQQIQAQRADFNFGDSSRPVPSVSSLSSYNNIPVSNATGIPGISIPLLELSSRSKDISLNLSLSYNPLNTIASEPASDVGSGWSLFGGGVISRNIVNFIDEYYDRATAKDYEKNTFDDIYYYNAPGISGKFKFVRDMAANTFELVSLSANKVKIEYTRTSNTATLILNSFTITDANGNKYFFNEYSKGNLESHPMAEGNHEYRSAFFLTRIVDANNVELASFTYQKNTKYKYMIPDQVAYEYCKLKTINSPGFGKIEFDYLYSEPWRMNDPYQVQKVILKDQDNHIISVYAFEYSNEQIPDGQLAGGPMEYVYKRILDKVKKMDKNNTVSETTALEYGTISYTPPNPGGGYPISSACPDYFNLTTSGQRTRSILKRVINPSGGVVEYNYEYGRKFKDRTTPAYLSTVLNGSDFIDEETQYLKPFGNTITGDTRQGIEYPLTISGTGSKKIFYALYQNEVFPPIPDDSPEYKNYLNFKIMRNGVEVSRGICAGGERKVYNLDPGNYTIKIFGSEGKEGIGNLYLYEIGHIPQPFSNHEYAGPYIRIGNITYYNSRSDISPLKTTRFEYNNFIDAKASSGYLFNVEIVDGLQRYMLYNNVKVIDDNNGYTQYYYQTPNNYPQISYPVTDEGNTMFWPYYSITSGGLLEKKEVYSAQNKLLASEETSYIFEDVPGSKDYRLFSGYRIGQSFSYSKLGWLKKLTNTSTAYFENGRTVQDQSETDFNVFNFGPAKVKKTVDGTVEEKILSYPETGYPNLIAANRINIPVIVQEKTDGKLLSRTETKFSNPSSVNPTSVISSNIGGSAEKTVTMDLYDEKGNVIQYTNADGKKSTMIYGYYKTLPIAVIEGASYTQVSALVPTIITASDADAADPTKESLLLTALDNFRNHDQLKDFRITTYTYNPLIGVTTTTPPNGIRQIYQYDIRNRLEKIVDRDGMILKEYKYNYKN